jgi:hypothetical protein
MTRLRQDALRDPGSAELTAKVRHSARNAAALRAAIAALSLALLALGTVIATLRSLTRRARPVSRQIWPAISIWPPPWAYSLHPGRV